MGTRLGTSMAVALAGLLLTLSAQAAPTLAGQESAGMKLQLTAPRILAQGYGQVPPAQRAPEPYYPPPPGAYPQPQAPAPYPQPMPGAYPSAAPEYGAAPYGGRQPIHRPTTTRRSICDPPPWTTIRASPFPPGTIWRATPAKASSSRVASFLASVTSLGPRWPATARRGLRTAPAPMSTCRSARDFSIFPCSALGWH